MKLFKLKIEEISEFELDITFVDVKNSYYTSPIFGRTIIVDFKEKKIRRCPYWTNAYINDDKFSISFSSHNTDIHNQGNNYVFYVPSRPILDKKYRFIIRNEYKHLGNSKWFKEKIIKTLTCISKSNAFKHKLL